MIRTWVAGLLRHRLGQLLTTAFGIAVAVALLASLGSFLTASKATMTRRATAGVAVDWQVAVHPNRAGGGTAAVLTALAHQPGTLAALPVGYASTSGLAASTSGTTQTTGPGIVLGLPQSYATTFPAGFRLLAGTLHGALVAQQTAANLHVQPGDTVLVGRAGMQPARVVVAGVVDLPQADSLFQRVGAAAQSQLSAPPDNVLLLPATGFGAVFDPLARTHPALVTTQIHVRRSHALPPDPAAAFVAVTRAAHHLEAVTSGAGVVGNNLGAVLDAAREDALYAQILFLFLGTPGAVLAAALTAAVVRAGTARRAQEQALLRARGADTRQLFRLVLAEAVVIGVLGGAAGLLAAFVIGRLAFGTTGFGSTSSASLQWGALAFAVGLVIAGVVVLGPQRRGLDTAGAARTGSGRPRWLAYGLDAVLLLVALGVFLAAGRNQYTLVLAPEGVPTISVSYWVFLAPGLAWIGAGLLGWRLVDLLLGPGHRLLARLLHPVGGNLATTMATMLSRQRRTVPGAAVLIGLSLSFAVSVAVFNATYHQQAEVDAQLTNGADVTLTTSPGAPAGPGLVHRLEQVPGVRAVASLQHRFAYVGTDLQDLYGIDARTITRATTLQDPYFQGAGAAEMMRRLARQPDAALVSAETVNDYQLSLGDRLRLRLKDTATQRSTTVTFRYAGVVNEFPTAPKDSFVVANAGYVAHQTGSGAPGAYLVDTGGSHVSAVAAAVRRLVGADGQVTTIGDARGVVGSSLTSVDLSGLTRLELAFAMVIAATAGALMMASGLAQRRRSIAVATALGATPRQLRQLTVGEPLVVGATGIVIGAVAGGGLSSLLVTVLTGVFDPPPSSLAVPWPYLVAVGTSVVLALAVASGYLESRTRRNAREYLREI